MNTVDSKIKAMSKGEVSEPKNKTEMKEVNGYLLFPVKENEKDFSITDDDKLRSKNTVNFIIRYRPLPKGNYSIIGLAKDLSEEQWRKIVEYDHKMKCGWPYYKYEGEDTTATHAATATISGHSLLKANNLNPNTTLILKKIL